VQQGNGDVLMRNAGVICVFELESRFGAEKAGV
jgi:hypothetical protein